MEESGKTFVYENGVRFEVTPHGWVYAPEAGATSKKHDCPDCLFCQGCSDSRCSLCRRSCGGDAKGSPGSGPRRRHGAGRRPVKRGTERRGSS
jgi:hypothetical protein